MQPRTSIRILICCFLSLVATPAVAVEFVVVGPRAAGMGGAGVAVTTDAYATYWNPAGLAMVKSMDIRIQGTGQVTGRDGIIKALDDLKDFDPNGYVGGESVESPEYRESDQPTRRHNLRTWRRRPLFQRTFRRTCFWIQRVRCRDSQERFVTSPVQVTTGAQVNLAGQMALRGLEARQAAFSYAYAFADKTFSVGITGKIIQGAAYNTTTNLQGGVRIRISGTISGKPEISTSYGIDVGAMYRPSSWLRFGVVGKRHQSTDLRCSGRPPIQTDPSGARWMARESLVDHDHYRRYGYHV